MCKVHRNEGVYIKTIATKTTLYTLAACSRTLQILPQWTSVNRMCVVKKKKKASTDFATTREHKIKTQTILDQCSKALNIPLMLKKNLMFSCLNSSRGHWRVNISNCVNSLSSCNVEASFWEGHRSNWDARVQHTRSRTILNPVTRQKKMKESPPTHISLAFMSVPS